MALGVWYAPPRMQQAAGRRWGAIAGVVLGVLASVGCTGGGAPAEPEDDSTTGSLGSSSSDDSSSGGEPGLPVPLVVPQAWEQAGAADDPFVDHRPALVQCEIGFDVETNLFEVDTELCRYGAFVQSTRAPIHEGDALEVVLLHDDLYAEEGEAVAHVAIAFGSEPAWQTELAIPAQAGQVRETWTAAADVEIGSPVHFHLHNHGTNNYRVVALTVAAR